MFHSGRPHARLTVLVLLAAVGLTSVLAWQAVAAARSHRAAAESVLRDYAAFAAWEFSRLARQHLADEVHRDIARIEKALTDGELASVLAKRPSCAECGDAHVLRSAFATNNTGLPIASTGEALPAGVRPGSGRGQTGVKPGSDRGQTPKSCVTLRIVDQGNRPLIVAWHPRMEHKNADAGNIGFTADAALLTHVLDRIAREHPLLPPTLTGAAKDSKALLAVQVRTADGKRLYASSDTSSPYAAEDSLGVDLADLRVVAALDPAVAPKLVIGGLPRDRLPLIAGLFVLTAGLVVAAVVQLRREAEVARLRADFISGVSHELRTPLAQIRMFSETLLLGRVRSEQDGRRSLEIITREAGRLAQLVENVLLFSRGERRTMEISKAPVRIAPLIAETLESFAPIAASRHTSVSTELDEQLMARVDAGAVRRILLNLLDNAVKYGPEGQTIAIAARFEEGQAQLEVTDEGPGIDRRDAARIWEPFQRLQSAAAVSGGAGIGLAIVRQLAELHGGSVALAPAARGARFVVSLPDAWRASDAAVA